MTESQLADVLKGEMSKRGGVPTFCIVAAGANSAEPHHGSDDTAEVSVNPDPARWGDPSAPASVPDRGSGPGAAADVVVLPMNQVEAGRAILRAHGEQLAGVIIDPLIKAGRMPHFASLTARGTRTRLLTISPTLSPVIWTTIATGVKPERHGIVDFTAINHETGEAVPVTSNLRRVPALWNRFSDAGRTVGFIGWWVKPPFSSEKELMKTIFSGGTISR